MQILDSVATRETSDIAASGCISFDAVKRMLDFNIPVAITREADVLTSEDFMIRAALSRPR